MPFSSINSTAVKFTDTLNPTQLWDFLAFAKLWPCLVSANAQSILPPCLLFLIPQLPLFLARYSSGLVHSLCSMVFALSGALGIECRHCQAACLSAWRWIPDSYSSSSPASYYPSPCLVCGDCCLTFMVCSEMKRNQSYYTQKPFPMT